MDPLSLPHVWGSETGKPNGRLQKRQVETVWSCERIVAAPSRKQPGSCIPGGNGSPGADSYPRGVRRSRTAGKRSAGGGLSAGQPISAPRARRWFCTARRGNGWIDGRLPNRAPSVPGRGDRVAEGPARRRTPIARHLFGRPAARRRRWGTGASRPRRPGARCVPGVLDCGSRFGRRLCGSPREDSLRALAWG